MSDAELTRAWFANANFGNRTFALTCKKRKKSMGSMECSLMISADAFGPGVPVRIPTGSLCRIQN